MQKTYIVGHKMSLGTKSFSRQNSKIIEENTKIIDDKQKIHSQKMVLKVKDSKINFKGLDCILTSKNRPFSALSGCASRPLLKSFEIVVKSYYYYYYLCKKIHSEEEPCQSVTLARCLSQLRAD